MRSAVVIGAGPAGLMAADVLSGAGVRVELMDHKPSVARKFLMAGKSGLNLTKDEDLQRFLQSYENASWLAPIVARFGPEQVVSWAQDLGQEVFSGSTGRVFPRAMKASPLLRAWLARLSAAGVQRFTQWRWQGWDSSGALSFQTADGVKRCAPDLTVLALGGGSWARLGSDGDWTKHFPATDIAPFVPSNMGIVVDWSVHMQRHFGAPLKNVALSVLDQQVRAEAVISRSGLEGGGIYALSAGLRAHDVLCVDMLPDLTLDQIIRRLQKPRGKASLSNHLRKTLGLGPVKLALLHELIRPFPAEISDLAPRLKAVALRHLGPRPLDEAISTAGGLRAQAFDENLMLRARPGVFVAGEMLDWEAPTGGYLITACLATGRWAGLKALSYLKNIPQGPPSNVPPNLSP